MNTFKQAEVFFSQIAQNKEIVEHAKRFDQEVQFHFKDDEPFYLEIRSGKFNLKKGESRKDYYDKIDILTDSDTFGLLCDGAIGFAEAMEDMKMECRDMIKRSVVGWFGKMVRLGQEYRIRNRLIGKTS